MKQQSFQNWAEIYGDYTDVIAEGGAGEHIIGVSENMKNIVESAVDGFLQSEEVGREALATIIISVTTVTIEHNFRVV